MERFSLEKAETEGKMLQEKAEEIALTQGRNKTIWDDYETAELALSKAQENINAAKQKQAEVQKEKADSKQEKFEFVATKRFARILLAFAQELDEREGNQLNELLEREGRRYLVSTTRQLETVCQSDTIDIDDVVNSFGILSRVFSKIGPGHERGIRDNLRSIENLVEILKHLGGSLKGVHDELRRYCEQSKYEFAQLDTSFHSFIDSADRANRFIKGRRDALERYLRT